MSCVAGLCYGAFPTVISTSTARKTLGSDSSSEQFTRDVCHASIQQDCAVTNLMRRLRGDRCAEFPTESGWGLNYIVIRSVSMIIQQDSVHFCAYSQEKILVKHRMARGGLAARWWLVKLRRRYQFSVNIGGQICSHMNVWHFSSSP